MIEIGNVVTLDNGQEYVLLEEVVVEGVRFIFGIRTENQQEITDDSMIFEAVNEDGNEYLAPIEDKAVYDELLEMFKDKAAEIIDSMDFEEKAAE